MSSRKTRAPRGTSVRNRPGSIKITRPSSTRSYEPSSSTRSYENTLNIGGGGGDERQYPNNTNIVRIRGGDIEHSGGTSGGGFIYEPDRPTQIKNCCRSVATFMCTQVGVGGIIVGYAIVGAFAFISLETNVNEHGDAALDNMTRIKIETAHKLLLNYNIYQYDGYLWKNATNFTLIQFQEDVVYHVKKKGYDGRKVVDKWNFPAALMFTLSIFTMIGYGNLVPRTDWGKVITICYAVFGIPLYVLYFLNMGRALARIFKWLYIKFSNCSIGGSNKTSSGGGDDVASSGIRTRSSSDENAETIVPSSASVYVLIGYITIGTIMFAEWEQWNYLDSVYFCVISLCKIGLGDFVPGTKIGGTQEGNQRKLVINFVYLLLGLGLVAMCYNLLREEVLAKLKQMKSDLRDFFFYIREECDCCGRD